MIDKLDQYPPSPISVPNFMTGHPYLEFIARLEL